jgi:hypothetical protein
VEYVNYSLIILAMLVALLVWLQLPSRYRLPNEPMPFRDTARQRQVTKKNQDQQARDLKHLNPEQTRAGLNGDLSHVPTPWGWAHYEKHTIDGGHPALANGHAHSISESLHHWADRLVQGKHTVDDEDYRRRREGWMRTLIEDRYGRSATITPASSAKLSGSSPTLPHDQMDNFSNARVDKIEARLLQKGQGRGFSINVRQFKLKKQTVLKDLKMPWGW